MLFLNKYKGRYEDGEDQKVPVPPVAVDDNDAHAKSWEEHEQPNEDDSELHADHKQLMDRHQKVVTNNDLIVTNSINNILNKNSESVFEYFDTVFETKSKGNDLFLKSIFESEKCINYLPNLILKLLRNGGLFDHEDHLINHKDKYIGIDSKKFNCEKIREIIKIHERRYLIL